MCLLHRWVYIYTHTYDIYTVNMYIYIYIHDTIYIYVLYKTIYIFSTGFAVSAPPLGAFHLLELFELSISTSLKVVTGRKFISFVDVHKKCFTNKYDKIRPLTPDPSTFRQDSPCTSWMDGQQSFWEVYPRPFVCLLVFLQNLRLKTSHVLKQGRSFGWSTVYPGYIDIFE